MNNPETSILRVLVEIKEALEEGNRIQRSIALELAKGRHSGSAGQTMVLWNPPHEGGRG